jgi:hypothetical protein
LAAVFSFIVHERHIHRVSLKLLGISGMVASAEAVAIGQGCLTPTAGLVLLTVVFARMLAGIPVQAGKGQSVDPRQTAARYLPAGGRHLRERVIRRVETEIPSSAMKPIAADTRESDRKRQ